MMMWWGTVVLESEHRLSCNLRVPSHAAIYQVSVTLRVNERPGVRLPWDNFIT